MWDRGRAILQRVVPLVAAAVAVTLVVALGFALSGEREDARAAARPVRVVAPEEADGAARTREPGPGLPATPFVRRLEVGADLRRLFDDVEEKGVGAAGFADRYDLIRPCLLESDGKPKGYERPSRTLLRLTEPRRDLASLVLAGASAEDALGSAMRVRIWTRQTAHPEEARARIEGTFDHIVRSVGREMKEGVDILVTPGMGRDVFPYQPSPWFAIGVYFRKDRYCAVRSKLPPDVVTEVAEHEIVHAYHRAMRSSTDSRFVSEGLAEYLRFVEPGDRGLEVPTGRLADCFAELQSILTRLKDAGVALDRVDPRRLVELPPREFYSLQHLGYLVAQAATAYVGGATVQRALEGETDAALVEAVRRIAWRDFLRFVEEGARGGATGRVLVIEDAPEDGDWYPRDRRMFAKALEAIGATLPKRDDALGTALARTRSATGLEAALAGFATMFAERARVPRVCIDLSEAMDRPVRLRPVPEPLAQILPAKPQGDTPRSFATELVVALAAQRRVEVVGLAKERRVGAEVLAAVETLWLPAAADGATPEVDILVVGSPVTAREAAGVAHSLGHFLLVIDLSADGSALEIAHVAEDRRLAAYWRPIEER